MGDVLVDAGLLAALGLPEDDLFHHRRMLARVDVRARRLPSDTHAHK